MAAHEEYQLLIDVEIPDRRKHLQENYINLENVAKYCEANYLKAAVSTKADALQETKNYTTHSLASVAYQINGLASSFVKLLDLQLGQLTEMESSVDHLNQMLIIHKEKVARREIGVLTETKKYQKPLGMKNGVIYPEQTERPTKYVRKPIDYTELDSVGHGLRPPAGGSTATRSLSIYSSSSVSTVSSNQSGNPAASSDYQAGSIRGIPASLPGHQSGSIRSSQSSEYQSGSIRGFPSSEHQPGSTRGNQPSEHKSGSIRSIPPVSSEYQPGSVRGISTSSSEYQPGSVRGISTSSSEYQASSVRGTVGKGSGAQYRTPAPLGAPPLPPTMTLAPSTPLSPPPEATPLSPPPPPDYNDDLQDTYVNEIASPRLPPPPPEEEPTQFDFPAPVPEEGETDNDREMLFRQVSVRDPQSDKDGDPYAATGPQFVSRPSWIPPNYIEKVVAIYDYEAIKPDELSFAENAIIYVIHKNEDGWWEGTMEGQTGLFPFNYVEPCI